MEKATDLKKQGNHAFKAKDFHKAISLYTQSLDAHDQSDVSQRAVVLTNRSNAKFVLQDYDGSLHDAQSAIKLDPSNIKAFHRKAQALVALGRLELAALVMAEATTRFPDNVELQVEALKAELKSPWGELCAKWYKAVHIRADAEEVLRLAAQFEEQLAHLLKASAGDTGSELSKQSSTIDDMGLSDWISRCALFVGLTLSDASVSTSQGGEVEARKSVEFLTTSIAFKPSREAFVELGLVLEQLGMWTQARALIQRNGCPWRHPFQRPGFLDPDLRSKPIWNKDDFPRAWWGNALEDEAKNIQEELSRLVKDQAWPTVGDRHTLDAQVVEKGKWTEIALFGRDGRPDLAPYTSSLISKLAPQVVDFCQSGGGEVTFSRMAPGTRIAAHCAPSNHRLTAHLGLKIPSCKSDNVCRIRVAEEWLTWTEGRMLVFDDSFEHEVENNAGERIVLLIRFPHPDANPSGLRKSLHQATLARDALLQSRSQPPSRSPGMANFEEEMWKGCSRCGSSHVLPIYKPSHSFVMAGTECRACGIKLDLLTPRPLATKKVP